MRITYLFFKYLTWEFVGSGYVEASRVLSFMGPVLLIIIYPELEMCIINMLE